MKNKFPVHRCDPENPCAVLAGAPCAGPRSDCPTSTPWMLGRETEDGRSYIAQENGPAYVARSVPTANADFIVRAANAHAALVASVEELKSCLEGWIEIQDEGDAREYDADALKNADAALRAARRSG